ncbi:MFS transporter [Bacillus testis]|uniref:MFS transporter n=1 Tax=Bacillus testis TaxID=1622072 RepID=UPI000B11777F|nr:MFS transporter [Bacillus testis]
MTTWKKNLYICWFGSFLTAAGMNLVIPFLPLYISQLGEHDHVEVWASLAFSSTFLTAAIFSPIWGKLADRYGRKTMLLRASLGMAIIMILIGFAPNVYFLVGARLAMGAVSGFIPAAIILVATQTPSDVSGRALGILSTGGVGGTLIGPVLGGLLADLIGLREVFWITGAILFVTFFLTLYIREDFNPVKKEKIKQAAIPMDNKAILKRLANVLITTFLLQSAILSIQPVLTLYVKDLAGNTSYLALLAGIVTAVSGFSNILSAPYLGKLSDKVGPQRVLQFSLLFVAIILGIHAFATSIWFLIILRFLLGFGLGGLLPAINTYLKKIVPESITGQAYGYNQTAQYIGSVVGPLWGGQVASAFGIPYVFIVSAVLLIINSALVTIFRRRGTVRSHEAA